MAKRSSKKVVIGNSSNVKATDIQYQVKNDKTGAVVLFEYERKIDDRMIEGFVFYPVTNIWINPGNNRVLKAYIEVQPKVLRQTRFAEYVVEAGVIPSHETGLSITGSKEFLRVGLKTSETSYRFYDSESSDSYQFFECKELMLEEIISTMKNLRSISGLNFAHFQNVPDDVLLGMGMNKLEDELGTGVPMWYGDVDRRFGYNMKTEQADSFVDSLAETLSV